MNNNEKNDKLYEQQGGQLNSPLNVKRQELSNLIIYSGDTKDI